MKIEQEKMLNERGQVILVLVLVITVALAIGISVVQRSLSDISTSTKVEESGRAFSAAEAGIEKGLKEIGPNPTTLPVDLSQNNNSSATVKGEGLLPLQPAANTRQAPLEKDKLDREELNQVWLADYNSFNNPPDAFYAQPTLDIYWGDPNVSDKAALELTLISYDGTKYVGRKWYFDQVDRTPANNFDKVSTCAGYIPPGSTTNIKYQCYVTLGDGSVNPITNSILPTGLMLLRARLLYTTSQQPLAVQGVDKCGKNCSLPSQQKRLVSVGLSGQTQRKVRLTQDLKVVPPYFDYALFSIGQISK